jgi:hypothetical protein
MRLTPFAIYIAAISFLFCLNNQEAFAQEKEWTATLKIVDDSGKPLQGANASVKSFVRRVEDEYSPTNWNNFEGLSDAVGLFKASHRDIALQLEFSVQKAGYYSIAGVHYMFVTEGKKDKQIASVRNPIFTLVLKKIIHPVPMYVNRVDIAHRKAPAIDKPVGFDLTVGDFVAPYGKGTNARMFFTWHVDYDTNDLSATYGKQNSHGWDGKTTISFPNPGDGIQEFDVFERFSKEFPNDTIRDELRSPQLDAMMG